MAKKRPASVPQPAQLAFPFELRIGDVIDDEGAPAEVVGAPKSGPAGKTTSAWVRREGETFQRNTIGCSGRS